MDKHYKDYIQIGLNIMRYRKEQGLTQDQLSEMAGYSRNHLQRVETAVCKPTVGLLLDVSEVLGVPVERLLAIRKCDGRLPAAGAFYIPICGSCVCSCCCSGIGSCSGPKSARLTMP